MFRRLYFGPKELDPEAIASCADRATRLQQIWVSCGTSSIDQMGKAIARLTKENPSMKNWGWEELQKFGQRDIESWSDDMLRRWGIGKGEIDDAFFELKGLDIPFELVYYPGGNTRVAAAVRIADQLGYMDMLGMFVLYE